MYSNIRSFLIFNFSSYKKKKKMTRKKVIWKFDLQIAQSIKRAEVYHLFVARLKPLSIFRFVLNIGCAQMNNHFDSFMCNSLLTSKSKIENQKLFQRFRLSFVKFFLPSHYVWFLDPE